MKTTTLISISDEDINGMLKNVHHNLDTDPQHLTGEQRENALDLARSSAQQIAQMAFQMGREFERKHSS